MAAAKHMPVKPANGSGTISLVEGDRPKLFTLTMAALDRGAAQCAGYVTKHLSDIKMCVSA